jgi:hypothetical protein
MKEKKPNCIVIGAMKAGTTSLHHYLDAHPDISMTHPKETHYFSKDESWGKGEGWYLSQFEGMDTQIRGETSPSYSKFPMRPHVPKRMYDLLPNAKLIYLLRDPIDRIISQYRHSCGRDKSIDTVIKENKKEHVAPSKYHMQLSQYIEYYDFSDILILESNNLWNNTEGVVQKTYRFLGINDSFTSPAFAEKRYQTDNRKEKSAFEKFVLDTLNGRSWLKPRIPQWVLRKYQKLLKTKKDTTDYELDAELRSELANELADDVSKLRDLTGREFSNWSV